jgi:hypothetical protein
VDVPKSDLPIGGEYAPVADRIALFYARFPAGRIITQLAMHNERAVVFRASVYRTERSRTPAATGWASERVGDGDVNTVACLENTETSAIGRALANLGFTASRNRPSLEEMEKAARRRAQLHPAVHERADALLEVLSLLTAARRNGLSPARANVLEAALTNADAAPEATERIGALLRGWLVRRRRQRWRGEPVTGRSL